jgi:rhodanese-related sulfurtransferase
MEFEIRVNELKNKLDAGEPLTILDVREPWEHATAHIEGSKHIPMGEVPERADQELTSTQHIVVICHHGVRSLRVAHWLRKNGFEKAQSLRGGIDEWSRVIDANVPAY